MELKRVEPCERERVERFLSERIETAMFLLGNLEQYGPRLGEHPNSGDFMMLVSGDVIRAVFALARRGSLLVETDGSPECVGHICDALAPASLPINCILAGTRIALPLWEALIARRLVTPRPAHAPERLFSLDLRSAPLECPDLEDRLARPEDAFECVRMQDLMCTESGIPVGPGTFDERVLRFRNELAQRADWVSVVDGDIVAKARLNARWRHCAMVGGVFTPREHRRKGFARRVMRRLLWDSRELHGLSRIVLFTGHDNVSAISLYEGLGFQQVGSFSMLFAE